MADPVRYSPPSPDSPKFIHWSDIGSYTGCRRKWDYQSHLRMGLEPRKLYAPFLVGTAVHNGLEHLRKNEIPVEETLLDYARDQASRVTGPAKDVVTPENVFDGAWDAELEALNTGIELAQGLLDHHAIWSRNYRGDFCDDDIEFISFEKVFRVPLLRPDGSPEPDVYFEGRMDGLIRHRKTNEIWVYELKTARSVHERIRLLDNDGQATAYCLAAEQVWGERPSGVLFEILSKQLPRYPEPLKNGMLSKNKSIRTSFDVYLSAIRNHHGAIATKPWIKTNYGDILGHLLNEADAKFFARVPVRRTDNELNRFRAELWAKSMEMVNPDVPVYSNPGYGCAFCMFKEPCLTRNRASYNISLAMSSTTGMYVEGPDEEEAMLLDALYRRRDMQSAYWDALEG